MVDRESSDDDVVTGGHILDRTGDGGREGLVVVQSPTRMISMMMTHSEWSSFVVLYQLSFEAVKS